MRLVPRLSLEPILERFLLNGSPHQFERQLLKLLKVMLGTCFFANRYPEIDGKSARITQLWRLKMYSAFEVNVCAVADFWYAIANFHAVE